MAQYVEGQPRVSPERGERDKTIEIVGTGSLVEAIGAAAAVVLAILGLAGANRSLMIDVACIVLGGALLLEGGAIAARYQSLVRAVSERSPVRGESAELAGGTSAETIGGIIGVVLGILALLGVVPLSLPPIALLAFGAALLLGSAAISRLNMLSVDGSAYDPQARRVFREAANVSIGGQVLVGIGAIVLGILALLGIDPIPLTLVGMLAVGASVLFSGSAIGGKLLGVLRHSHA